MSDVADRLRALADAAASYRAGAPRWEDWTAETESEFLRQREHLREREAYCEALAPELARGYADALDALATLLADDDMPKHWDDCECSYCRANRRCRAVVADADRLLGKDTT